VQLFKSKCLPILYYGLEVCRFNKSQIDALQYVEICCFGKIFNTRSRDLTYECTGMLFFNCQESTLSVFSLIFYRFESQNVVT